MASHALSARDVESGKFAFEIYDFEGNGTMDAYHLGDCLRALKLNPTNAAVEKMGGTKLRKQKQFKVEEFLPVFAEIKNAKDEGGKEDFLECLRLYDKQSDGKMLWSDLQHILISLGEALEESVANEILAECCEPEDEDGFIPYEPFINKLIASAAADK